MAKTTILPASAMQSPRSITPESAIQGLTYSQIPGAASYAAAAPDGSLWVLSDQPAGPDKYIWHYVSGAWTNISGLASRLSVAPNGALDAINSSGGAYSYSGGTWSAFGGGCRDLSAAADGSLYVISNAGSADGAIWHYASGAWTQQPGSGNRIAASWDTHTYGIPGGSITPGGFYVINSVGNIYYLGASGYIQFPGAGSAIAPMIGGVFVLGYPTNPGGNALYYYDLDNPGWSAKEGAGANISANGNTLYVIGASGGIYAATITPVPASFTTAFVANRSAASVTGYAASASGNAAPTVDIAGSNTLLNQPIALAVDSTGRVYTANDGSNIVYVFSSGATGNVAPAAQVQFVGQTEGVTLDSNSNLWVSSFINNTIYEFAAGATGTPTPLVTIVGANTQLSVPENMFFDASGKLYVSNHAASIVVFAAGASGNATPLQVIGGSNTQLIAPYGVAVDGAGRIVVADSGTAGSGNGAVRIYAAGATGNVAPIATIGGPSTQLSAPSGVKVDGGGNIWVSDNAGAIFEFASGASGNVAPLRSIQGSSTLMNQPYSLTLGGMPLP